MISDFREFRVNDLFGHECKVTFVWLQTAISIRHADAIDVKFTVDSAGQRDEKIIAIPHAKARAMAETLGRPLNDAWVSKLAATHLARMIESGEDLDKALVTMTQDDMDRAQSESLASVS